MADIFSHNSYQTAIFGKWHLGDNYPFRPQDRGFKEVIVHGGGAIGNAPDYWDNNYFDDVYRHNGIRKHFSGYCTDVWFSEALKYIEHHQNEPFFCYIATNAPHLPVNVPEEYILPYRKNGIPENRARFYGMITNIDDNIGRLFSALQHLGLAQNTILIFMTDNGSAEGLRTDKEGFVTQGFSAGLRGKKGSEYDGGHRVPFFIRWPEGNIQGGQDVKQIAAHIDVLPTLVNLCGLKLPKEIQFDGTSLKPLLERKTDKSKEVNWLDRILITDSQRVEHPIKWRKSSVMTNHWRLVNGEELYDIQTDPEQRLNVAEQFPEEIRRLREAYEEWWISVSERFDEESPFIIGSEYENPVLLTCHDWHSVEGVRQAISGQVYIRRGDPLSGYWAVEISRKGRYEITLCRWPEEVDIAITSPLPGVKERGGATAQPPGRAIKATHARLSVGDHIFEELIPPKAAAVSFKVQLEPINTRLQTWFIDKKTGETHGAYFVYVKRI
jgi:arylsulfatase A-like enzyme